MDLKTTNILFGPPSKPDLCENMLSMFFSQKGKHIVCGGTTASITAQYLGKPIKVTLDYIDIDIPPIAEIEGMDLVTEGIITLKRVLQYAYAYLEDRESMKVQLLKLDAASQICRILFTESDIINIFAGHAVNPLHQNTEFDIDINTKIKLTRDLAACLNNMNKNVKVFNF